jgi:hypothetical protein
MILFFELIGFPDDKVRKVVEVFVVACYLGEVISELGARA